MKREKIIVLAIFGLLIWVFGPHLLYLLDTSVNNNSNNTRVDNTDELQKANIENQYRATITQAFVGIAVLFGVYQTWQRISIAEDNLKISQEGQITERFTRAIDQLGAINQLGNPAIEIRLGGIYALERIANESDKDYWSIIEILTAYVRINSNVDNMPNKNLNACRHVSKDIQVSESIEPLDNIIRVSLDAQAILTFLGRRKYRYINTESRSRLNLCQICLNQISLPNVHFEGADFEYTHLKYAFLIEAHLEETIFRDAHLERAILVGAHLEGAMLNRAHIEEALLTWAYLEGTDLESAHLERAHLQNAHLEGANLEFAHLEGADLMGANLEGSRNLSVDQLSKVKTLYNAKLDETLLMPLKEKYPHLFEKPDYL